MRHNTESEKEEGYFIGIFNGQLINFKSLPIIGKIKVDFFSGLGFLHNHSLYEEAPIQVELN